MVRIGENGSNKRIRLYYVDENGRLIEILSSSNTFTGTAQIIEITVTYDPDHTWILESKIDDELIVTDRGEFKIPEAFYSSFFCYQTTFTSTRIDRFGFGPVHVERTPVFITAYEIQLDNTFRIVLSENIESNHSDNIIVQSDSVNEIMILAVTGNTITFRTATPLSGGTHVFVLSGLIDPLTGQHFPPLSVDFLISESATLFDVIINEFTPRPDNNQDRFVELYNRSDKTLSIDKWTIGRSSQAVVLNYSNPIQPGELVVIGPNISSIGSYNGVHGIQASIPVLARTQDALWIRSESETLIDSLYYNNSWGTRLQNNRSVERIDADYIGMDPANWASHPTSDSKGLINVNQQSNIGSVKVKSAFETISTYEVVFESYIRLTAESSVLVNGIPSDDWMWSIWSGNMISIPKHHGYVSDTEAVWIDIFDVYHFAGNNKESIFTEIGRRPAPGDLLINEILYQPLQERYSSYPDQSEFVELINTRPYKITLRDILLRDAIDKNGQSRSIVPESSDTWMVEAHGYAIIVADTASSIEDSRLARFFGIVPDHSWARADRSTLSLTSTGRDVIIADKDGTVIDSVRYTPDLHHPLLRDTRGISLERTEGLPVSMLPKWTSSADPMGATPGTRNSNFYHANTVSHDDMVSVHPNPFSPDMDGHEDVTIIEIRFQDPGYLVRLTIYDRYGHQRKVLINDAIAGSDLSVSWDGTNNRGNLLSTGVYILHVQAKHDGINNEINLKKPIVLVRKK